MKRKEEMKLKGLKSKSNGDWYFGSKIVTSKQIRNASADEWDRIMYSVGENKYKSIVNYLKRHPYTNYTDILYHFSTVDINIFDQRFEKAFDEWRKIRKDFKFDNIN